MWLQSFALNIGTKDLMSKCVDHKTTFLDTHRHFRPATEISKKLPIVCGGLELKKSNVSEPGGCHDFVSISINIDPKVTGASWQIRAAAPGYWPPSPLVAS